MANSWNLTNYIIFNEVCTRYSPCQQGSSIAKCWHSSPVPLISPEATPLHCSADPYTHHFTLIQRISLTQCLWERRRWATSSLAQLPPSGWSVNANHCTAVIRLFPAGAKLSSCGKQEMITAPGQANQSAKLNTSIKIINPQLVLGNH